MTQSFAKQWVGHLLFVVIVLVFVEGFFRGRRARRQILAQSQSVGETQ